MQASGHTMAHEAQPMQASGLAAEFTAFAACVIDCDSSFYFSHISRFIGLLGLFSFTDEGGKVAGFILQIYCQFSGNPIISPKKFRNVFLNIIFIQMSRYGRAMLSWRRAKPVGHKLRQPCAVFGTELLFMLILRNFASYYIEV